MIAMVPVQTQKDGYNCGLFAVAFAADIFQEIATTKSCFELSRTQEHLIECLEKEKLSVLRLQNVSYLDYMT